MDGAEIKDDLLEISFGRPDEDVVLLKQRHYSVAKICVPETVQYTVAFLWCWPMINFLRFGLVACLQVFKDPIIGYDRNRSIRSRNRNFSIAIPVLITGTGISICSSDSGPTGTGILHLSSGSG